MATPRSRPVRVVVGGQVPPPVCGQHVAVAQVLRHLRDDHRVRVEHLEYRFATDLEQQGRPSVRKVLELGRLLVALLAARRHGPIDVFLHPISGPATAAAVKDAAVVAAARLVSRRVALQFHGGGHALDWSPPTRVQRLVAKVFARADLGVVHARFHEPDPAHLGMPATEVVPHRVADRFDPALRPAERPDGPLRVLYVGHLGPHRGTPELVQAVGRLHQRGHDVRLVLVGRPAQGWTRADLAGLLAEAPAGLVEHHDEKVGRDLDAAFAAADLFAFPSRHEAESFGLVLVEALMWGLPVVASDWRAAPEVLAGDDLDVVLHATGPTMGQALEDALASMVHRAEAGSLPWISKPNRLRYEQAYRDDVFPLADVLVQLGHRDGS